MLGAIALFTWLGASFDVAACSCAAPKGSEEEQVQAEFAAATHVYVGKVLSVQRAYADRLVIEEVELKVARVLKGSFRVGQTIRIRSMIAPGMCGRSIREGVEPSTPVAQIGEWLIYGYGDEPHEISLCSRSRPVAATEDLEILGRNTPSVVSQH